MQSPSWLERMAPERRSRRPPTRPRPHKHEPLGLTMSSISLPRSLAAGAARITGGRGVDVVIESVGGALTGQALATLAPHGALISLGYSAGRKTTIDVTDLIWKRA